MAVQDVKNMKKDGKGGQGALFTGGNRLLRQRATTPTPQDILTDFGQTVKKGKFP
ncbi:MAG: hypothetical protein MUO63_00345 [Desulfobulbaceae bacterium]|nr:hypothetical protein [Desulfobulbaceae bacterium]